MPFILCYVFQDTRPKLSPILEGSGTSRQQSTEDAAQLDNEDENAPLIVEIS